MAAAGHFGTKPNPVTAEKQPGAVEIPRLKREQANMVESFREVQRPAHKDKDDQYKARARESLHVDSITAVGEGLLAGGFTFSSSVDFGGIGRDCEDRDLCVKSSI